MRTPKEHSIAVEAAIAEIDSKRDNVNRISNEMISEVCQKYGLREKQIRTIAGWKDDFKPRVSPEFMLEVRKAKALLRKHKTSI